MLTVLAYEFRSQPDDRKGGVLPPVCVHKLLPETRQRCRGRASTGSWPCEVPSGRYANAVAVINEALGQTGRLQQRSFTWVAKSCPQGSNQVQLPTQHNAMNADQIHHQKQVAAMAP